MTEDLQGAYDRLTDSQRPPVDAAGQVARRIGLRRRRRRAGIAGGVAVLVMAGAVGVALGANGDQSRPDDPEVATDPSTPPSPSATPTTTAPAEVTCPVGTSPAQADLDHSGYGLFAELVAAESGFFGGYVLDEVGHRLLFLRADGTAHAQTSYDEVGRRWFPVSALVCSDSKTARTPVAVRALPALAAADLIGCTRGEGTSAHADVADPAAWDTAEAPGDLAVPFTLPYDTPEVYRLDDRHALVSVVGAGDGVNRALSVVRDDDGWHLGGIAACSESLPGLATVPVGTRLERLDYDHCLVQPFAHAGTSWLPPYDEQFGGGGGSPPGFLGLGVPTVDGDRLVFTDVSGAEVELIPADDPRAAVPEPHLCD